MFGLGAFSQKLLANRLKNAILEGDLASAMAALDKGSDPNGLCVSRISPEERHKVRKSLIGLAITERQPEMVALLASRGAVLGDFEVLNACSILHTSLTMPHAQRAMEVLGEMRMAGCAFGGSFWQSAKAAALAGSKTNVERLNDQLRYFNPHWSLESARLHAQSRHNAALLLQATPSANATPSPSRL